MADKGFQSPVRHLLLCGHFQMHIFPQSAGDKTSLMDYDEDSVEYLALCEGVQALMETRRGLCVISPTR